MQKLKVLKKVSFARHSDPRGELTVAEFKDYIDWEPKRIYYVTSAKLPRGGHAVSGEKKIYVCVQGHCKGRFHDGENWIEHDLKGPADAIIMEDYYWREFVDFSEGAVLLAISSINYEPDSYQYDLDEYIKERSWR